MMSRTLTGAAIVAFLIIIGLLAALIVLIVKVDKTNTVVCKNDYDASSSQLHFGATTANTIGKNTVKVIGNRTSEEIAVPDCPVNPDSPTPELDKAKCILESYPLIDGHNDLAAIYRIFANNSVNGIDLRLDTGLIWNRTYAQTDIPKLREGKIGAQFWSCWVDCNGQYKDAVRMTLDQLDVIRRFVAKYPDVFQLSVTPKGILDAFKDGKIASLIGLEGGHSIDSSLGNLRMYYEIGVRYMTLTHSCNTPWADNWLVDTPNDNTTKLNGLTDFGKNVILEMNRIGMMVDLAHASKKTMEDVLTVTKAPIIFSHSSAFHVCNHYRNVQDDILLKTKRNGGVVMVNFYNFFIHCPPKNASQATIPDVADHIDHIKSIAGIDHVGIGSDFSGIPTVTTGLENVSKYPYLFAELIRRNYTDEELRKIAGKNLIRVFKQVEKVRDDLSYMKPLKDLLPENERINTDCRTDF